MSEAPKTNLIEKIIDKINTRDILSVGALGILTYGVYTRYFQADAVITVVGMVFAFWFGSKATQNGST